MKPLRMFVGGVSLVALAGCEVGPDFKAPPAPEAGSYTSTPLATTVSTPHATGGEAQRFEGAQDIPAQWWTLFHSQPLNELIERSLAHNPDLKAAEAALAVAQENVRAQQGFYYPTVTAGLSANRQKTSSELSPTPNSGAFYFSLYTPQVSVSYSPDVFGLNRRTVESLDAQKAQARYALAAARISLSSNVAAAAIQEASLRAQIDATSELIRTGTETLAIFRNQLKGGYASRLDVASQESQLAQVASTLPPLQKQLDIQRDLLAALAGGLPDKEVPETFTLSSLRLPEDLPVSLPSALVEHRPDVKQAEETLHAASAQIGIAVANRLPNIALTADAGTSALSPGNVFMGSASAWDLGAGLTQPLFDGGTLKHKEHAARDAYQEALAQYRSTVISAFQNVADTLHALERDADALKAAAAAEDATRLTLDMTRRQMQTGYANNLALFNAENAYQQAAITLVQAEASRYADTAALFQALGGGWWNDKSLPK
ncbi:MAG: efflux transporter outer membrane subunit [Rhizomicrobium sp.]|jgi:NodT family efflux transporter outer membrane factor (OMF) lipoprotein